MRTHFFPRQAEVFERLLACFCVCLLFILCMPLILPAAASPESDAVSDILQWKGIATTTEPLAAEAGRGNADWYALALTQLPPQTNVNLTPYREALRAYTNTNPTLSITDRLRIALVFSALNIESSFVTDTLSLPADTINAAIFSLQLHTATKHSPDKLIQTILSLQLADGGWALWGTTADIDLTAMAVQSLAPHVQLPKVTEALERALARLIARQQPDGGYISWGIASCESIAQVLRAAVACGIDPRTDSRFIKNGHTLLDALLSYQTTAGGFSHTPEGLPNDTAGAQTLAALLSLRLITTSSDTTTSTTISSTAKTTTTFSSSPNMPAFLSSTNTSAFSSPTNTSTLSSPSGEISTLFPSNIADSLTTTHFMANNPTTTIFATSAPPFSSVFLPLKPFIAAITLLISTIILLILHLTHRLRRGMLILIIVLTIVALIILPFLQLQTPNDYYTPPEDASSIGTVTLAIRCDTALPHVPASLGLPSNGEILAPVEVPLQKGDTVFSVLERTAQAQHLMLDFSGSNASLYIKGIAHLYEYDAGATSGWMFRINGVFAASGAAETLLSSDDSIEWVYTRDFGQDVE